MKKEYYSIDGRPDLARDPHSKGLIMTDMAVLRQEQAKQARKLKEQAQEDRLNTLEDKLDRIETLLLEIAKT